VAFPAAGFFENLLGRPVELAEVAGEEDSREEGGCAGATAHAERNLVVEREVEARGEAAGVGKDIDIGGEDEIVVDGGAELGVAAGGIDVEGASGGYGGVDGQIEGHGKAERVKAGAEVG
jgi:hypothetical protein